MFDLPSYIVHTHRSLLAGLIEERDQLRGQVKRLKKAEKKYKTKISELSGFMFNLIGGRGGEIVHEVEDTESSGDLII